jgi:hypothetical protein
MKTEKQLLRLINNRNKIDKLIIEIFKPTVRTTKNIQHYRWFLETAIKWVLE